MLILEETTYSDGSGWLALVDVRGVLFAAHHVAGEVRVRKVHEKPRATIWAANYVRTWAEQQVANLPADYHRAHSAMYDLLDKAGA